jgi:hypothetical protein
MKKILAIAALVATTTVVQAASLNWSATTIYQPGTTTALSGGLAYLFISAQSGDFGAKIASVDDIRSYISEGKDLTEYIAATGATNDKGGLAGATGYNGTNFGAGDSLTAFVVVFDAETLADAKNYIVTAEKTASWTSSTGAKTIMFGSQKNATWTAVPEPSTAVLALAGLALLLKRRKA